MPTSPASAAVRSWTIEPRTVVPLLTSLNGTLLLGTMWSTEAGGEHEGDLARTEQWMSEGEYLPSLDGCDGPHRGHGDVAPDQLDADGTAGLQTKPPLRFRDSTRLDWEEFEWAFAKERS